MKQMPREFLACAFWTAALVAMIFGTVDAVREGHNSLGVAWGIFLAVVAHMFTCWSIIRRHHADQEVSVKRIVEIVDALHVGRRDVSRLR
jgi:uncharacterized membrane protein